MPFDPEAERSILAGIFMEPELISIYGDGLSPDMFHDAKNAATFESMQKTSDKGLGVDIITVASELKAQGKFNLVGGEAALMDIQTAISNTYNFESWCRVVKDLWCRRKVMGLCDKSKSKAMDCSVSILDTCNSAEIGLHDNALATVPNANRTSTGVMRKAIEEIQSCYQDALDGKESKRRVSLGLPWMDDFIKIYRGGLSAVGAFTGAGKTAWEIQCFTAQAVNRQPVCLGCTESSAEELLHRIYAHLAHLRIEDVMSPRSKETINAIQKAQDIMAACKDNWMIWGEDDWESDPDKFCYLVSGFHRKKRRLDMWWLDHFCDIPTPASKGDADKFAPVQRVMTKLKRLSSPSKTNSAGMILSQFTKATEEARRPTLSSFYGSAFFTQPLRMAAIIYNTDKKPDQPPKEKENCLFYSVKSRMTAGFCRQTTYVGRECTFYPQVHSFSKEDMPPPMDDSNE